MIKNLFERETKNNFKLFFFFTAKNCFLLQNKKYTAKMMRKTLFGSELKNANRIQNNLSQSETKYFGKLREIRETDPISLRKKP